MSRRFFVSIQFFLGSFFFFSFTHSALAADHLVGHWKFDEVSGGTTAADASGVGNTATINADTTLASTDVPVAIDFSDPYSTNLDGAHYFTIDRPVQENFTLCTWAKTGTVGIGDDHWVLALFLDAEVPTLANDFGFGINTSGYLAYGNGGAYDMTITGTTVIADNAWHHNCVTRNQTTGEVVLYVDGVVDGPGTTDTATLDGTPQGVFGSGTDGGTTFATYLDDFRVYDTVLSADDIALLAAGQDTFRASLISSLRRAGVDSWKAALSTDATKCPYKLKLTLKGRHFDDDAEVTLGGHKAASVDVTSSKKLTATFCLEKFSQNAETLKKTLSVKNPSTRATKASKRVDLTLPQLLGQATTSFNQDTEEGIINIQKLLVSQELLLREEIVGKYGPKTEAAVKAFQAMWGIPQTGSVGPRTLRAFQRLLSR